METYLPGCSEKKALGRGQRASCHRGNGCVMADGAAASSSHRSVAPSGQKLQQCRLQGAPQGARIEACRPLSFPTPLCLRAVSCR